MWGSLRYGPAFRWDHFLPIRDLIDRKTAMIDESYTLVFGDEPHQGLGRPIDTGVTDFSRQECWVNTQFLKDAPSSDQFAATVYLAAHERAHARWTDFHEEDFYALGSSGQVLKSKDGKPLMDILLHNTWNILEDERIERLLGRDYPHLHYYLWRGSELFLAKLEKPAGTDSPAEVLVWVLYNRVATRAGLSVPCPLSPSNQALLAECQPLIDEAFSCSSSRRVVVLAREILKKLKLDSGTRDQQMQKLLDAISRALSGQKGGRKKGDEAESDGASEGEGELYAAKRKGSTAVSKEIADQLEQLFTAMGYSPEVRRGGKVRPAPYESLLKEVRPFVEPLRHLFKLPPSRRMVDFEETGSRLSMRALLRTPKTPFRVETVPKKRGKIAVTVVVDDSGSMSGHREHQAKLTTLMVLEALGEIHRVRVVLAPTGRVVADRDLREMSRAFIAGYDSSSGTEYGKVMAAELKKLEGLGREVTRYLFLVADGMSGSIDGDKCAKLVAWARKRGIHVFGVGIELGDMGTPFYEQIFGRSYISLDRATQLPARMQALLRRAVRNRDHRGVA